MFDQSCDNVVPGDICVSREVYVPWEILKSGNPKKSCTKSERIRDFEQILYKIRKNQGFRTNPGTRSEKIWESEKVLEKIRKNPKYSKSPRPQKIFFSGLAEKNIFWGWGYFKIGFTMKKNRHFLTPDSDGPFRYINTVLHHKRSLLSFSPNFGVHLTNFHVFWGTFIPRKKQFDGFWDYIYLTTTKIYTFYRKYS